MFCVLTTISAPKEYLTTGIISSCTRDVTIELRVSISIPTANMPTGHILVLSEYIVGNLMQVVKGIQENIVQELVGDLIDLKVDSPPAASVWSHGPYAELTEIRSRSEQGKK